jgi:zinc and cadmium transporter
MDDTLVWILGFGTLMAIIALIGGLFILLPDEKLQRILKPMVAFAAGSLLGGALFWMMPKALSGDASMLMIMASVAGGFTAFFALDQLLEWHHCHRAPSDHVQPLGPLLLVADGVHNLLGGLSIGAIFVIDIRAGVAAWIAAALHEIPQEVGDFGAIVHAGYSRRKALFFNFLSALSFPLGGVVAWSMEGVLDVHFLVALGAGNFLYIAGADLLPEIKRAETLEVTLLRFLCFCAGLGALFGTKFIQL